MKDKKQKRHAADLRAIHFEQVNFTYAAPAGMEDTCAPLPCSRRPGQAISCWTVSFWQRLRFLFTGRLWFWALMDGHPPVAMMVRNPFKLSRAEKRAAAKDNAGS